MNYVTGLHFDMAFLAHYFFFTKKSSVKLKKKANCFDVSCMGGLKSKLNKGEVYKINI